MVLYIVKTIIAMQVIVKKHGQTVQGIVINTNVVNVANRKRTVLIFAVRTIVAEVTAKLNNTKTVPTVLNTNVVTPTAQIPNNIVLHIL